MTTPSPATLEFDKLMKTAEQIVHEKNWDASLVISLATSLAVHVNSLTSLSGPQKKQLVLDVVKAKIHETVKGSTDLSGSSGVPNVVLDYLVENALPVFLDTLIAVSRGKIDLKKVVPKSWAWYFSCLGLSSVQVASVPQSEPVLSVKASSLSVAVASASAPAVPLLSSQPPVGFEGKTDEIPLQSNPLYKKSDSVSVVVAAAVVSDEKLAVVKEEEAKEVSDDTEIPPQQNTDTATEVPNVVEVSPSTRPETL